jgi:hypothetical protein
MRCDAGRASEGVVISLGIQMWAQLLNGIRMAFGHVYLTELAGFLQILGNAYRLASPTDGGSGVAIHRRFLPSHRSEGDMHHRRSGGRAEWDTL